MKFIDNIVKRLRGNSDIGELRKRTTDTSNFYNYRDPVSQYYQENTAALNERSKIYKDMDDLDNDIISTVLDMGADDATQMDLNTGKSLWCKSEDPAYETVINKLFSRIKVEEKLWRWAREIYKYGDFFLKINPGEGLIKSVDDTLFPSQVCRLESQGTLLGFLDLHRYRSRAGGLDGDSTLPPYSIVHFRTPRYRVVEDLLPEEVYASYEIDKNPLYGSSTFLKARKVEKRISLINDALALTRLARSMVYRIHSVNVGDMTVVDQRKKIMKDYQNNISNAPGINFDKDRANITHKDLNFFRELFVPKDNDGKGQSEINDIGGNVDVTGIADIDYLTSQRFGVLGIPKSYVSFDEAQSFNSLIALDTRYARKIVSLQKALISGLTVLCQVELVLHNLEPDTSKFSIHLVPVSTNGELDRNDALNAIIDICNNIKTFFDQDNVDKEYLAKYLVTNYLKFPNFEIDSLFKKETVETPSDESIDRKIQDILSQQPSLREDIERVKNNRISKDLKASELDILYHDDLRGLQEDQKFSYNKLKRLKNLKEKSNTIGIE